MIKLVLMGFIFIFWHPSIAEYRAFELVITDQATGSVRKTLSNLDPLQYPNYYPLKNTEVVTYTQTWMCKGRTGNYKEICANPKLNQNMNP